MSGDLVRLAKRCEGNELVSTVPVVFILSTGHAGGTLLNLLLGTSQSILAIGESLRTQNLKKLNDQSPSTRDFWSSVLAAMDEKGWGWSDVVEESEHGPQFWQDWFCSISYAAGSRILADKTPSLELVRFLINEVPVINPFFIHLIRDPRAVCYSYMKKNGSMFKQIYTWNRSHLAIESFLKERKNSVRIRYEDLSQNPNEILEGLFERIMQYYGLEVLDRLPAALAERTLDDGIFDNVVFAGNRMRHAENRKGKMIALDEEYRKAMPAWRWQLVSLLCATQLRRYGYIWSQKASRYSK